METSFFSAAADRVLSAVEFRLLQIELMAGPELGAIIEGSVGLRKLRCARQGQGKRGGLARRLVLASHQASRGSAHALYQIEPS